MSSIPTAKAALFALWSEALTDAQVIYSGRNSVTVTKNKIVTVGTRATGSSEFSSLDEVGATERYQLACQAQVTLPGTGLEAADDQVVELWRAARVAVNGHDFGPQLNISIVGDFEFESAADKDGRYASVKFAADVFAIL